MDNLCMARLILEKYLEDHKITKYRFAKMLGVKPPVVHSYFREKNGVPYEPKLQTMARWARVLKCKISDLYDETKDIPANEPRPGKSPKKARKKAIRKTGQSRKRSSR